ncbi:aldehyde oxidoreductase molybdenum-binding subunit PaoC [Tsuneonella mangrovi]|uniref:aldehyde oxidoreductase molybdenum-binding subunit PaoC n=1 Tax=Tsuneonella mangrovi TaxID=1982042 RepID=UPI000BA2420F|nr:aldehyde oxidoreductase molybdenum-binding subunit PaoC [Tsuneonella mangrovi]
MKFDQPAAINPIDQGRVIGKATARIDGPLKVTGTAPYAAERHDVAPNQAYGWIVGAGIAKGRLTSLDTVEAKEAPGVLAVLSTLDHVPLPLYGTNTANLFGGATIEHYHQAIALVVAETFEQACGAAKLIRAEYERADGLYDLDTAPSVPTPKDGEGTRDMDFGDFAAAWDASPVRFEGDYVTRDESHAMMEPFASIAAWEGDKLTVWTTNQLIEWSRKAAARTLGIDRDDIRLDSPFVGGGFGGKLFIRAEFVLAALGAKEIGRPVKVAMQRPLMINNSTHRPATRQTIKLGADENGKLKAISHSVLSGNLPGGSPEGAEASSKLFYGADAIEIRSRLATLDLPEGNAMRAPGEAPGLMAFEVAMDELAEQLDIDPVQLRIVNDTQVDPMKPERKFTSRLYIECLERGAKAFGWDRRIAKPASVREGEWLIGMGMAGGIRNNFHVASGARVRLAGNGTVTVETDMTDIGTGSYTIIAQTAAEMMGLDLDRITVRLGSSDFPVSAGSGGQFGGNCSTAGVYAACVMLRRQVAEAFGMDPDLAEFVGGEVRQGAVAKPLGLAAGNGEIVAEDTIEFGDLVDEEQQSTFAAHFVEAAVNAYTGETRIRRMLAVCSAGRILNPSAARSQIIGAMTMGAGAALMEELAIDQRFGMFINHDLAGYEVPVHADIPHQEVIFLDDETPRSSPMKAMGVGELGLCGVGAAIANAQYNATGVRIRNYPLTLDKYLDRLPAIA